MVLSERVHELMLVAPGSQNKEQLRKIVEFAFRTSGIKVRLVRPKYEAHAGKNNARIKGKPQKRAPANWVGKVIINTEGKIFSEVLASVKKDVDPKDIVKVKRIAKNMNGDIVLSVKRGAESASALLAQINLKAKGLSTRTVDEGEIVGISDMDKTVEEEDVIQALMKLTGLGVNNIKINNFRKGRFDSKVAAVKMPKAEAAKIVKLGKVYLLLHIF